LIADVEIFVVDIIKFHATAIVRNGDRFILEVEIDIDVGRIGVPSVGNHFGYYRWDVAVEIEAQVVEFIETDRHPVL